MSSAGKRVWRWIAGTTAALAIVSALLVGGLRLALELLPEYQSRIADTVRSATGLHMSFDSLDARIGRYGPEIYFKGARIVDPDGEVLVTATAGRASLSVLRSVWFRRLEIGRVILDSPRLNLLIFPDRHVELVGQAGFASPPEAPRRPFTLERVPRGTFEIRDATLVFRDLGADGATWDLTSVDIEFQRKGGTIDVRGDVKLPQRLGQSVEVEARASGDLANFESVHWRARLMATQVDLSGWAGLLPETFTVPTAGKGSVRLSARGKGKALERGRAVLGLDGVALPGTGEPTDVAYARLAGDLQVEAGEGDWRISGRGMEFSVPGSRWKPSDLDATLQLEGNRLLKARIRTGFVRAQNLMPLIALAPATPLRERIETLAIRGTLRDIDLEIIPAGSRQMPDLRGSATFKDVGFAPFSRFPGVTGVDGSFEGRGAESLVYLDATDVELDWPEEWRVPVPFARVRGTVALSRALGGVRIASDDAVIESAHGEATGRLRMLARPQQTPLMDIDAHARVTDISAVPLYLPKKRLSPAALQWLDNAFPAGQVTSAEVRITGPVQGFPYREGEGRFTAIAQAEGVTLNYAPGWQPLTGVSAHAEFSGTSLRVTDAAGNVGGMTFHGAAAEVGDWRDSIVVVHADAAADAGTVRSFFASSPLAPQLGPVFERLSGSGPVEGEVVMYLPIKQFADRSITVHGKALGVSLALDGIAEPATDVEGEFWVRNREFHAPRLTANLLGGTVAAAVVSDTQANGEVETRIEASGTLDGSRLPRIARLPVNSGLDGITSYRGTWEMRRPADPQGRVRSRVRLDSDLVGLASGLPAPLAKSAEERRPLGLDLDIDGGPFMLLRASLGRNLRTLLEIRRGDERWQLARGAVRLGGQEVAALPVSPGLSVDGQVPYLSISDLAALRWDPPGQQRLQDLLASANLDIGRFEVLGYEFDGVSGRLRPGNRSWDVVVAAPTVEGTLQIPYAFPGEVPLVADLERLKVSPRIREDGEEGDPRQLPGMRIDIRDLVFLDWQLGHLTARIEPVRDGVELKEASLQHPAFEATGSGAWRASAGGSDTALRFELDSGDLKGFLGALALAPVIEAKKGRMVADVSWPGGPDRRLLERISGTARVTLSEGRVLSVEPGAGRMLGLMSLSHIGKRLSLDFEDLTGQGMAFDSVKGDFALASGVAFTDNLTLRGPAAEVGIAGRTSLKDQTYDQTAVVTGDLGASLGVAGALAGGPAVGAALLLFSQIFKEPLKGVARAYYRITGPWDEPVVKKIDARELEEATGTGPAPIEAPVGKGQG